jgi:uncharacterized protein (DUF934 family)
MAKLIKNREIVTNDWKVLTLAANDTPESVQIPFGPVLVPLAVWQARKSELIRREWEQGHALGLWLGPKDDPAAIKGDIDDLAVIGVNFPAPNDGRGYSLAALLRGRYGFTGELRALGNIGRDQIFFLQRVGFDAFAVAEPELAIAGLDDFSESYQAAANQPLPLYRRRSAFA